MSDNPKDAVKEMEKAIFISADCWLKVFDLLTRFQLGFGIAMISRRFDHRVDEHFKTRKWTLGQISIRRKIGQNGAKEMEIVTSDGKALPIPQNPLPNKVIGFRSIKIIFIDQNVLTFLRRFDRFFSVCATKLASVTENIRISEFLLLSIWPMFKDTTYLLYFYPIAFRLMRQLAPSILSNFPSLHVVAFHGAIFPAFPPDDSANVSDGQAVAKWLFTPHPSNLMKVLHVTIVDLTMDQWSINVEQIKAAFSSASSSASFVICVVFPSSFPIDSILPFELTNEMTGEQLILLQKDANCFVLVRCSIVPDEMGLMKFDEFELRWNRIDILIGDGGVDDGLLDGLPGPSGDQQQAEMDLSLD